LLGKFTTQLAGKHSVLNTLGVLALCHCLGLDLNKVRQALNDFIGSERRLELKGEIDGILVYDDYAHHPTAVTTTLDGLKRWYPDRQLWCVFQPHTFSRTRALLKDFANCFGPADHVLLTEIWGSARESAGDVSSRDIVALGAKHHPDMRFLPDQAAVKKVLLAEVAGPSVVVTMGAGDVYHLGESYLEECKIQNATASSGAPPKAVVKCKSGLSLRGRLRRPKQSRRWQ
jgi:UDP-N-acetylmuramate--alanine ligase